MNATKLLWLQPVFVMGVTCFPHSFFVPGGQKSTATTKPDILVVSGTKVFALHDPRLSSLGLLTI